ncbi:nostrin-like isoform X2 [Hydractinia symbiolongicarpus]|uniref:nostrin-like isoform X2 n=1 Tax=Hydractinia symbiolongicarpus TaxID=13093 RepID=UPI00255001D5|nr:nostrin-like isoform X2 [Hydractinia symbiolongicarpus]
MTELKDVIWSHTGFEDLKKYCHKNNEFLRDAASLFQERAKLEIIYADGLAKIATKARKICIDTIGTLRSSWEEFSTQTDLESNVHKHLSAEIIEEVAKPLKTFADTQKESRKAAEQVVEKAVKVLAEKRTKESQGRKSSHNKAKESEGFTVQLESARGKTLSEKELSKLDAKCKKAEEAVTKSDNDYITKLIDAERARLELESAITGSTIVFQTLEEEKVTCFKTLLTTYCTLLLNSIPKYDECYKTLEGNVSNMNPATDIQTLIESRGTRKQPSEQIVFTCYEEDFNNTMDNTRRKMALENKLSKLTRALQGEKKAKKGLVRLNSVYSDTPSFSTKNTQQDVGFQLGHTSSVINLLEASIYRLNIPLAKLLQRDVPNHRLSKYIDERRDKQGSICCTLRVPIEETEMAADDDGDDYMPAGDYQSTYNSLTYAHTAPYGSCDGDDFSDVDPDFEDDVDLAPPGYSTIDMCKADYDYTATEKDELTIKPGDVITIITRHDDGWWKGELKGKVGLFPASYVHELK